LKVLQNGKYPKCDSFYSFSFNFLKNSEKFKSSSGDEKTNSSLTDNNGHIIKIKCDVSNIPYYHVNFDVYCHGLTWLATKH